MIRLNKISSAVICLLVLLCSQASFALGRSEKFELDNGLTVVITELPGSPMVSVYGLVKAGSATEGKYLGSGLSHFLEHMLFKGTQKRGVGDIATAIQSVGGTINAMTGRDYTMFTISAPDTQFDI